MPFTDPVSSISGRNSRASNVSGMTGASRSVRSQPVPASNDTLANAGVLSMLKTTTDTGDIGALSFNNSRLPTMPRATHHRRGHAMRLSGSSNPAAGMGPLHHYAPSQTSRVSSSREQDSMYHQRRGSLTSMQSMPPSLPPVHVPKGAMQMPLPAPDGLRDSRSYSMTSAPPAAPLPRHRSAASLRSQGHEPGHPPMVHPGPGQPAPPMPENRPPYVYPTRLKRPGYRSPSPALSETFSQGPPTQLPPPGPPPGPPMTRRMPPAVPRGPPPQAYNGEYGPDYSNDPRFLNARPPPRTMSSSPVMAPYGEPQAYPYPYRNPAAMRSAPGLSMPSHNPQLHPGGPPPIHPHLQAPPPHPHAQPMMHRAPYPGPPYPPRPGYPLYPPMHHASHRGLPPPPPNVAPMAHQMFHNAARMARQLPHRTDTPMTDGGPPSSDPPSSGTAPTSSSPPTPRDQTSIQVAVDPAFIDPALADLQDSSSEPVLPHHYLRYTEALDKDVDEPDIEAAHKSVPPSGFVQRVKAMLESRAATEIVVKKEPSVSPKPQHYDDPSELENGEDEEEEIHELAANETPRFTVIEEFQAPVELPASPVKIAELGGSPIQPRRRITRDIVKAGLARSSTELEEDQPEIIENGSIDDIIHHKPRQSPDTVRDAESAEEEQGNEEVETFTPGHTLNKKSDGTTPGSRAASSPAALGMSAVDHAVPFDSTTASDETQSRDPFILDADTITLQHQRSKEKVNQPSPPSEAEKPTVNETQREAEAPVSPLLAGEDASRCSVVSPLHTQTLGIDETIHMASDPPADDTTSDKERDVPGAYPEDSPPPPTPKTPKTYSKSVQLQPSTIIMDTPSSNRYSLPPDLSTVGDSTINTNSDMITDVAVRFSLPQTTITISRPQIIEIPPSSSPEHERPATKPAIHASGSKSKRHSVAFADDIAPLKINKKPEEHLTNSKSTEARLSKDKSIVRRPSPLQESIDSSRTSRDSTTDLRFSGINNINSRFGSTHLPGLKEESIEDMSISEKRGSDVMGNFQFPLPARIAAVKAMQERRLQESAEKAKARRAHRHPNRPLAETRDLPSLNFSRMDLIDKLNEALEVRSSRSMDIIRRREFSGIYCPSPQRPQSTEPLRERYMSFFSKPEDFTNFLDDWKPSDDEDDETSEPDEPAEVVPIVEVQPSTELDLVEAGSRSLSPEDFLNVATQVNRLSIPSVSGLSERLSEILPNLRDLQLDDILANFGDMADDIRRLEGIRPDTVLSTRTSAGFRTLAERAEEIVKNGTHDSTMPITKVMNSNKDLPPLPESMSADKVSAIASVDGKQSYLSGSVSAPSELGKDVVRPPSALTRNKSPMTEDEVRGLLPPEMNPIARTGKRALVLSSASSRPWNQDENYPWTGTKIDVDLAVPSQAHVRDSSTTEITRKRDTKSSELTISNDPTDTSKGIDIGSLLEHDPTASLTSEQLTGLSTQHHFRKPSKRSVIGSLTRKIGLGSRLDSSTTRSIPSPAVPPDATRSGSTLPHRPGERYPTTGLTPPAAFNIDEVRSFFSDNSSEKERNTPLRKRLTGFKGKSKSARFDSAKSAPTSHPSRAHSSLDGHTTYDAGEMNIDRIVGATSSAHTYDGVGMSKTEFRIKRIGEKLRSFMAKSGELIRSWSQRSTRQPRTERVRDDWLSDSLYSGV